MRVLVITPNLSLNGGVANYFRVIRNHLSIDAEFFEVGALQESETLFEKIRHLYGDRSRLYKLLSVNIDEYDVIHINPSFAYRSLIRDGLLLKVAKRLGKKTLVFFRGWNEKYVNIVNKYCSHTFFSTYNNADAFIVLASEFERQLRNWGFSQPIYLETTVVDDELLSDFSIEKRLSGIESNTEIRLLFLSRIHREKGICEAIEVLRILLIKYPKLRLIVAGDGDFMPQAREFANRRGVHKNVSFLGHVNGKEKKKVLLSSDVYVFPTYREGMPNSVLEAMAFGLPVVTRPVGGLKDFFVDGQHGFMSETKDPSVIASLVDRILMDRDLWKRMSSTAHEFATERFMASKVARRLTDIYSMTLNLG